MGVACALVAVALVFMDHEVERPCADLVCESEAHRLELYRQHFGDDNVCVMTPRDLPDEPKHSFHTTPPLPGHGDRRPPISVRMLDVLVNAEGSCPAQIHLMMRASSAPHVLLLAHRAGLVCRGSVFVLHWNEKSLPLQSVLEKRFLSSVEETVQLWLARQALQLSDVVAVSRMSLLDPVVRNGGVVVREALLTAPYPPGGVVETLGWAGDREQDNGSRSSGDGQVLEVWLPECVAAAASSNVGLEQLLRVGAQSRLQLVVPEQGCESIATAWPYRMRFGPVVASVADLARWRKTTTSKKRARVVVLLDSKRSTMIHSDEWQLAFAWLGARVMTTASQIVAGGLSNHQQDREAAERRVLEIGALPSIVEQCTTADPYAVGGDKERPLVSVVIPTYNRGPWLRSTLQSLQEQSYADSMELWLIDDASDDAETRSILTLLNTTLFQDHERWHLVVLPENKHIGHARNVGASLARGEWLFFFDDDDVLRDKHVISMLVGVAQTHPDAPDIVTGWMDEFEGRGPPPVDRPPNPTWAPLGGRDCVTIGLHWNCFGAQGHLHRRSHYLALGGSKETVGVAHVDYELFSRAALAGARFALIPKSLYWYRKKSAHSVSSGADRFLSRMHSLRAYLDAVPEALRPALELAYAADPEPQWIGNYGLV